MSLELCFLGQHDTKTDEFKNHSHNCYELIYFTSGEGKIFIEGKVYSISANSYAIIPPNTEHTEIFKTDGKIMFIGFKNSGYEIKCGAFNNAKSDIITYIYKIFDEYKTQESNYKTAIKSLISLLLIETSRQTTRESKKCHNLDYLKTYIEQYYYNKINFKELSELSGYSYDYFRVIFKRRFGESPQTYLIDIRLNHARQMLESTNLSCTEIAYDCGFSNSAQMSTMFKKKFGISPTSFKITD